MKNFNETTEEPNFLTFLFFLILILKVFFKPDRSLKPICDFFCFAHQFKKIGLCVKFISAIALRSASFIITFVGVYKEIMQSNSSLKRSWPGFALIHLRKACYVCREGGFLLFIIHTLQIQKKILLR